MKKKIVQHIYSGASTGILVGLAMSIIFCYLHQTNTYLPAPPRFMNQFSNSVTAMVVSVLLWLSIGMVFSLSNLIFTETDWSILRMTVTHLIASYLGFLPLAFLAGWFPLHFGALFTFSIIYIIIYTIIWFITMRTTKKELTEMNQQLKK